PRAAVRAHRAGQGRGWRAGIARLVLVLGEPLVEVRQLRGQRRVVARPAVGVLPPGAVARVVLVVMEETGASRSVEAVEQSIQQQRVPRAEAALPGRVGWSVGWSRAPSGGRRAAGGRRVGRSVVGAPRGGPPLGGGGRLARGLVVAKSLSRLLARYGPVAAREAAGSRRPHRGRPVVAAAPAGAGPPHRRAEAVRAATRPRVAAAAVAAGECRDAAARHPWRGNQRHFRQGLQQDERQQESQQAIGRLQKSALLRWMPRDRQSPVVKAVVVIADCAASVARTTTGTRAAWPRLLLGRGRP